MSLSKTISKAFLQLSTLPLELFFPRKCLYVAGDLHYNYQKGDFFNHNLGDDLNFPLVSSLSGKHVLPIRYSLLGKYRVRYLVIGSILNHWCSRDAIVWGAGLIHPLASPIPVPKAIYAVRGPLTRMELLRQGIKSPPVYGDPAILMPRLYLPSPTECHDIALIPHVSDIRHPFVVHWQNKGGKLLDIGQYGSWRQFIQELRNCKAIISSSLHGLILSDAYGIPARRIKLGDLIGDDFKFNDYYLSYRQHVPSFFTPQEVASLSSREIICRISDSWQPIPQSMQDTLLENCPFLSSRAVSQ